MSGGTQPSQLDVRLRRYRALCEVAESIAAHHDFTSLLEDLKERLQLVVKFDAAQVVLHDPEQNLLRRHVLKSSAPGRDRLISELAIEEAPSGWVWQTQEPMLINDLDDAESRYPRIVAELRERRIKTVYILPLTSLDRRLGTLGFISRQESAWDEDDQEFLQQVAKLVAVAVDNAINFENARAAEAELRRRLEHLRLMLNITTTVVSQLDLHELLKVISTSIREAIGTDAVTVSLFDDESGQLRTAAIDAASGSLLRHIGFILPLEDTPGGLAFTSGQPVLTDTMDLERFPSPVFRQVYEEGYRSGGSVPLIAQGRKLGVLGFASKREYGFSADDKELLCQIANQIAIAVDNSLNFGRARAAEEQARRQSERRQLLLEINNAVVSNLDLRELLKVISNCLRQAVPHDVAVLTLHDAQSAQLRVHALDQQMFGSQPFEEGVMIDFEGTPEGQAITSRQPVLVGPVIDLDRFSSPFVRYAVDNGVRSGCAVPLISHDHTLGALSIASLREDAFTEADVKLLGQCASQIAIAVENALNFERARQAEQEVRRQLERERLMLEINNAVVSNLNLPELLAAISAGLRRVLPHDFAGMALYDADSGQLRVQALDSALNQELFGTTRLIPLKGTAAGKAFTTRQIVLLRHMESVESSIAVVNLVGAAGFKSSCHVPLISRDRALGTLDMMSLREDAFSDEDAELLSQIANQIAIAVDNSLNFERARVAEQQASRQSERLQLLLQINNATASALDLSSLFRAVSASLREVFQHDFAVMGLYDEQKRELRAYALEQGTGLDFLEEGMVVPLVGTPVGLAVTSKQAVILRQENAAKFPSEIVRRAIEQGMRSSCSVPLLRQNRVIGAMSIVSRSEGAFTREHGELLMQIAGQVAIAVENALAYREIESLKNKLSSEKLYLEDEIRTEHNFEELIGDSRSFKRLLKQVETVAPTDSAVLIRGETGTGKELLARAIHDLSARRARTLVKLNCAAIPTGLLESELFGHEKGAFTGAISQRIGRFELANRGTLFLDEVGDIPPELQPKLLRVLQEQEFERLGSTRTQKVDVRLIAATNADLEQLVAEKKYRSDLYYRLNVFPITVPPLRERREDIPTLARFFTQKYARRLKKQVTAIPAETLAALTAYSWPGNVRELEHFIERAVILTNGSDLRVSPSELKIVEQTAAEAAPPSSLATLHDAEREHIRRALEEANWVVGGPAGAAARLGLKRSTLQSRMQKLGISRQT